MHGVGVIALLVSGLAHGGSNSFAEGNWASNGSTPITIANERYLRTDSLNQSNHVAFDSGDQRFSALFDYRVGHTPTQGGESVTEVDLDSHVQYQRWRFDSESAYRIGAGQHEQTRLSTAAAYDLQSGNRRLTLGDQSAPSGELGAPAKLLGVGLGDGAATRSNCVFVSREAVCFDDGSQDQSYRLGWLHNNDEPDSEQHGQAAFSGYQRLGLGGGRTVGLKLDAIAKDWSAGGSLSTSLGTFGTLSSAFSTSQRGSDTGEVRRGYAAALSHRYQAGVFSTRGFVRSQSEGYHNPLGEALSTERRWLTGVDAAVSAGSLGSFSAVASKTAYHTGAAGDTEFGLGYSKTFASSARLSVSLTKTLGANDGVSGLLGFSYTLGARTRSDYF
jgi:outer membrane usher protein FimD/PapC